MSVELLSELEKVEVLWETLESKLPKMISDLGRELSGEREQLSVCYQARLDLVRKLSREMREITDEVAGAMEGQSQRFAALKNKKAKRNRFAYPSNLGRPDNIYNPEDPDPTHPEDLEDPRELTLADPMAEVIKRWKRSGMFLVALAAAALLVKGLIGKNQHLKNIRLIKSELLDHAKNINLLAEVIDNSVVRSYIKHLKDLKENIDLEESIVSSRSSWSY